MKRVLRSVLLLSLVGALHAETDQGRSWEASDHRTEQSGASASPPTAPMAVPGPFPVDRSVPHSEVTQEKALDKRAELDRQIAALKKELESPDLTRRRRREIRAELQRLEVKRSVQPDKPR